MARMLGWTAVIAGFVGSLASSPAHAQSNIVVTEAPSSTPADQLDALVPCAGPMAGVSWKNQGQYIRSVVQAVERMLGAGSIAEDQGDALISERVHNDCGQPKLACSTSSDCPPAKPSCVEGHCRQCTVVGDCQAGFVCRFDECVPAL
jgi:hypothetical protein